MSDDAATAGGARVDTAVDWDAIKNVVERWYPAPVVGVVVAFMLYVRLQAYDNFVRGGQVYFSGNDAYYHFREVSYTVRNWPATMPFDPWTQFPYGTAQGQFGTFWDQIIATAALVVGLGSPSEQTVALTTLVAPAVAGALVAVPVYFLGKRLAGRPGGVTAAIVLALLPGTFLRRSLVGFADHHVAEVFLQTTAVVATLIALRAAEQDRPVYEQLADRDWAELRRPVVWAAIAGVSIALYVFTWPPGVVLVGIGGVFYAIAAPIAVLRGRSPEHLAFVGAISHAVVALAVLATGPDAGFSSTTLSLAHPTLAAAVVVECVGLAGLARVWDRQSWSTVAYPTAVGAAVLGGLLFVMVALPDLYGTIESNALRAFGFGQSDTTLTIAEAKAPPLDRLPEFLQQQYGLAYLTAIVGVGWTAVGAVRDDARWSGRTFVVVWAVFLTLMALTQVRFNYYLAVGVAAGNAAVVGLLWTWLDLGSGLDALDGVETYQLVAILAVAVVVVVPLAVPPAASATALDSGQRNGPGSVTVWQEGLSWMSDSTPDSESADLGYYGTHPQPADGDFEYPESAYGVMSWWDYGHWITIIGQRIPVANPFQQGARVASAYLQSPSERRANAILDALPSLDDEPPVSPAGNPAANTSTAELERIADEQSPQRKGEDVRYVVIDDQMAGGKFSAITRWQGPGTDAYFRQERFQLQDRNVTLPTTSDRYDRTLLSRLYYDDASDLGTYRLVHEVNRYAIVGGYATPVQRGGRRSLQRRPLTRVPLRGGWSTGNGTNAQNISRSLERARGGAVPIGRGTYVYDADVESRVKTYERVAGATLTGTAPNPNATVRAVVGLQVTNTGRQFRYSAEAQPEPDGSFSLTVPYPTEADLGPADGGTDETVVATGEYILFTGNPFAPGARGNATVPERAVLDGETITVDLEPADTDDDPGASGGNETETGGGASASGDDPQGNETTAVRPPAVVAPTGD